MLHSLLYIVSTVKRKRKKEKDMGEVWIQLVLRNKSEDGYSSMKGKEISRNLKMSVSWQISC